MNCLECGHITNNPKFCSRSCSATYTNRVRARSNPSSYRQVEGYCITCNTRISTSKKYCDECQHIKHTVLWGQELVCRQCDKSYVRKPHSAANNTLCASCVVNSRRFVRKRQINEYLGDKCVLCGYDTYASVLHAHHTNPETKSFDISGNHSRSWNSIKAELDKCILLCANCHTAVHQGHIEL